MEIDREIFALSMQIEELKKQLSEARRRRAREVVPNYSLRRSDGEAVTLSELFDGKDDLILIHNMGRGCAYCTLWADGFNGLVDQLESRSGFVVVSPDEPLVQSAFAAGRGWRFKMASAAGTTLIHDLGYEENPGEYMPGFSAFRKDADGTILRTGRDFFGPGDDYSPPWRLFDLLQGGAGEWEPLPV